MTTRESSSRSVSSSNACRTRKTTVSKVSLVSIPSSVAFYLGTFLPPRSLSSFSRVCRALRSSLRDSRVVLSERRTLTCEKLERLFPADGYWRLAVASLSDENPSQLPLAAGTLEHLRLQSCSKLTTLPMLSGLEGLLILDMSFSYHLADISALAGCEQLQSLRISCASRLTSIAAVSNCRKLTNLAVCGWMCVRVYSCVRACEFTC
jgi:hypothetical protein